MNTNSLEMSPTQGTLLLFEDTSNSPYSNQSSADNRAAGSKIVYSFPRRSSSLLSKYLEEYFSEVSLLERAVSAKCNECGAIIKGSIGVTSNFLRHLRQRHPFIEVQKPGRLYPSTSETVVTSDYHQLTPTDNITNAESIINTGSLMQDIQIYSHPKQRVQAEALLKWITSEMIPSYIVDSPGFLDFCKVLDPTYTKTSGRTLNRMLLGTVSSEIILALKTSLSQIEDGNIHLTVDVWEKRGPETGVFVLRIYFINEQWVLQSHTIGFASIENEREETENLLPSCASTLGQYGIDLNKVGTITTGNAWKTLNTAYSNLKAAEIVSEKSVDEEQRTNTQRQREDFLAASGIAEAEEQREKHLPGGAEIRICKTEVASDDYDAQDAPEDPLSSEFDCLQAEHLPSVIEALHRVAQKAIDSNPIIMNIMNDVFNILSYARRNNRWRDELIDHLPRKFRGILERNWNSKIDLLQWYSEDDVYNALSTCLSNAWNEQVQNGVGENPPTIPSQESLYDCKTFFNHLFSPLSEAVDTLQTEGTLASLVIPAMCGIVQAIWSVKEREEVKRFTNVADSIIQGIDFGRCKNIREHDVFILATILDPRFKLTAFPDECAVIRLHDLPNRKEAVKILREAFDSVDYQPNGQILAVIPDASSSPLPQVDTTGAQDLANKKIFSFYMDRQIKKARHETEVESYLAEDANPTYNPLSYWKLKENTWPKLAIVARKVLSIPTCQGSPTRLFKTAKDITNANKFQIDLETMENMILYREQMT